MHAPHWIVTSDSRRARLFRCEGPGGAGLGRMRVDVVKDIERPEHSGGRSAHDDDRGSGGAGPGSREEEALRFARQVAEWIVGLSASLPGQPLTVFAAPRFAGLLRDQVRGRQGPVSPACEVREGELTHLRPQELAIHPEVIRCVNRVR